MGINNYWKFPWDLIIGKWKTSYTCEMPRPKLNILKRDGDEEGAKNAYFIVNGMMYESEGLSFNDVNSLSEFSWSPYWDIESVSKDKSRVSFMVDHNAIERGLEVPYVTFVLKSQLPSQITDLT